MSKYKKLIKRLISRPKDFTYGELVSLLHHLGYDEIKGGKTRGSSRAFLSKTKHLIRLHEPHPNSELRMYQVDYIIQELRKENLI